MPSLSVTGGWTFANAGPATTTFAPAPRCTSTDNLYIGLGNPDPYLRYELQCSSKDRLSGCVPTGTAITSTKTPSLNSQWEVSYLSPGLYCPLGWATVGVAARDAKQSLSSSGILSVDTSTAYDPPDWDNPATLLASILDPSETLALCCPRYVYFLFLYYNGVVMFQRIEC